MPSKFLSVLALLPPSSLSCPLRPHLDVLPFQQAVNVLVPRKQVPHTQRKVKGRAGRAVLLGHVLDQALQRKALGDTHGPHLHTLPTLQEER